MFTIENMFSSSKGKLAGILFDALRSSWADVVDPSTDSKKLRELFAKHKWWGETPERKAYLEELKRVSVENQARHTQLLSQIDVEIRAAETSGNTPEAEKLKDFKKTVEKDYIDLRKKHEADKLKVREDAMNKRAWLTESVESKDNNPRQAEALMKGLKKLTGNAGAKALIEATEKWVSSGTDEQGTRTHRLDLGATNIRGLIDYALSGLDKSKYRSNGAMFIGDSYALSVFDDVFKANKDALTPLFQQMRAFYDAGQTTEDWLLALDKKSEGKFDKTAFTKYLSEYREGTVYNVKFDKAGQGKLETKDRSFMTLYAPGELEGYLGKLPDATLLARVSDLIKLGGLTVATTDLASLQKEMYAKPELRAAYIKWLNYVALSNSRADFFATGKLEAGIDGAKANTLTKLISDQATQEKIKSSANTTLADAKTKVGNDPALSPEQKKVITAKIDGVVASLNSGETLKTFSLEWAAAITNRRVGGGASIGTDLNSMFADSVSLSGGGAYEFGRGYGGMLALIFTKEIFASEKIELWAHYGLTYANAFAPLLGVHGRYEDILASVTGTPVGYSIYVGLRTGTNRNEAENIQRAVSKSQEVVKKLATGDVTKLDLSKIISNPAIATRMTEELKVVLGKNDIATANTPEAKYMVMYSSLVEVMNMEVLRLYREKNDMGWTLDQIGVNFGELAWLVYVLPGFRIERNDLQVQFTQYKRQEVVERKSETIDTKTLFGAPVFGKGKEYSLPLVKWSKIATTATDIPPWASWNMDSDGNVTAIEWLKDKGVKVTLADGKYKVEYDDKKPVRVTEAVAPVEASVVGESLDRVSTIGEALSNPQVRMALSNLLINPTRKAMANEFARTLQGLWESGNTIEKAKAELLKTFSKPVLLPAFRAIAKYLEWETDAKKLQSALFDLRGAMMMDMNQADKVSRNKDGTVSVGEGIEATKKRFDAMLNSQRMSELLTDMGVSLADYKDLIQKGNGDGKSLAVWTPKLGILGAFASLKTSGIPYMARMPAWTVRYAQSGDREFVTELANVSSDKKRQMLMTVIPSDSVTEKSYRAAIAKALTVKEVSSKEFEDLMTKGEATIGGKKVKMTDQKFYLAAYGDCTNPGIALQVGKITTEVVKGSASVDISATAETAIMAEVTRYGVKYGLQNTWVSIAAGYESPDERRRTADQTEYRTEIETRNVPVSPANISGVPGAQVINIPGGGTVPVNQLTVAQRIALINGTLTLPTQVQVQVPVNIPGRTVIIRDPNSPMFNGVTTIILPPSTGMNDEMNFTQMVDRALPALDLKQFNNGKAYLDYLISKGFNPPAKK